MKKNSSKPVNPSTHLTQLKQGCVVKGNLKSAQSIRVDGFVTGDLISDEKIIIGNHGEIGGNLIGLDISIDGYVNGDVLASGVLSIGAKAQVFGKIYARQIGIENGAELNGKITVGENVELPQIEKSSPSRSSSGAFHNTPEKSSEENDNYGKVAW